MNELNHRLLRYDDMRIGTADVPEESFNAFNMGWQTKSLVWHNATEEALGSDKITPIYLNFLNSRTQDDYGYIYNQGYFREDPLWGGTASWGTVAGGPQGWTFPTEVSAVADPFGNTDVKNRYFTSYEFNKTKDSASDNWKATNGSFDTKYNGSILSTNKDTNGYAEFSASTSDYFSIYNDKISSLLTKYGGIVGSQAAFVEIDMDFKATNLADIKLVWKTKASGSTWFSASAKDYVTIDKSGEYSNYGSRSYWPMYLNSDWNGQIITGIGLEFIPVSGTTLTITEGKLNYIRPSYDTRQPQFAFQWFEAFYNYVCYTRDEAVLKSLMPKARKAMLFMLHCLQGETGLVNLDFFCGHNGIGTTINSDGSVTTHPGEGIASGYWDTLALPEINVETNAYFYSCLKQMAELEKYCEAKGIVAEKPSVKNRVLGGARVYYTYDSDSLYALLATVKDRFSQEVKAVKQSDGRYKNEGGLWNSATGRFALGINELTGETVDHGYVLFNEQAIAFGLGTTEQRLSVMQWINGDRIVSSDISTGSDIYFYEYAPRFTTADCLSQFNFALAELNFGDSSAWKKYGSLFSRQVQNGGAVLWASYYDIIARAQVLGEANAYARVNEIVSWYNKVKTSTMGTGTEFFKKYYEALESTSNQGYYKRQAADSEGAGAVGIDSEFLENVILTCVVPEAFFGMKAEGLDTITFTNNLPVTEAYLRADNLKFGAATYSITETKDGFELSNVQGATDAKVVFRFNASTSDFKVYINGVETKDYTVEDGYIVLKTSLKNVTVTIKK